MCDIPPPPTPDFGESPSPTVDFSCGFVPIQDDVIPLPNLEDHPSLPSDLSSRSLLWEPDEEALADIQFNYDFTPDWIDSEHPESEMSEIELPDEDTVNVAVYRMGSWAFDVEVKYDYLTEQDRFVDEVKAAAVEGKDILPSELDVSVFPDNKADISLNNRYHLRKANLVGQANVILFNDGDVENFSEYTKTRLNMLAKFGEQRDLDRLLAITSCRANKLSQNKIQFVLDLLISENYDMRYDTIGCAATYMTYVTCHETLWQTICQYDPEVIERHFPLCFGETFVHDFSYLVELIRKFSRKIIAPGCQDLHNTLWLYCYMDDELAFHGIVPDPPHIIERIRGHHESVKYMPRSFFEGSRWDGKPLLFALSANDLLWFLNRKKCLDLETVHDGETLLTRAIGDVDYIIVQALLSRGVKTDYLDEEQAFNLQLILSTMDRKTGQSDYDLPDLFEPFLLEWEHPEEHDETTDLVINRDEEIKNIAQADLEEALWEGNPHQPFLFYLYQYHLTERVKWYIETCGPNLEHVHCGKTILEAAVSWCDWDMIDFLLGQGADESNLSHEGQYDLQVIREIMA